MDEFAHMQQSKAALDPKITNHTSIQELSHAALKHIQGAPEFLEQYFSTKEAEAHRIPRPIVKDQIRHLPFGNIY